MKVLTQSNKTILSTILMPSSSHVCLDFVNMSAFARFFFYVKSRNYFGIIDLLTTTTHKHTHMALNIDMSWARVAIYVVFHVSTIIKQTQYWSSKIDTFLRIVNDFNWMQWSIFIHFVFDRKQQVKGGSLLLLLSQINNFRIWKNNSVRAAII